MRDLRALEGLSGDVALERLWQAVEALLPSTGRESYSHPEIIAEVCERLKIRSQSSVELSTAERALVLGGLAEAMLHYGRDKFDLGSAKQRLGARGELPLAGYKIGFSAQAKDIAATRSNVEEAVRKADRVQHLQPPGFGASASAPFEALSLFAKRIAARQGEFTLLVVALRKGSELNVTEAWRVYDHHVDTREVASPLDLLRRFVAVYGLEFSLGPRMQTKFVLGDAIPLKPGEGLPQLEIHDAKDHDFHASIMARASELGVAEIALGYVVDLSLYRRHLNAAGVHVR